MNNPGPETDFDIVVVGAGLVGSPLAQVLSEQGWRVALLDQRPSSGVDLLDSVDGGLSQRCTALSLGSKYWFDRQGLWQPLNEDACPIRQVVISQKGQFGSTRLRAAEMNVDALGYVINNELLTGKLLQLIGNSSVHFVPDSTVTRVSAEEQLINVYHGTAALSARLLIAADGVSSSVRECLGTAVRTHDYDQSAVLGMLSLETDHNNVAFERFTETGPLALLPRPGNLMNFVECIDSSEVQQVSQLDDDHYRQRLQQRFGMRLGRFDGVGPRHIISLNRIEAAQQIAPRTLLLGNAARLLHPVGGQGYNLAIRDIAQLQRLLGECITASGLADPGKADLLSHFVKLRASDQRRTVQFTHTLARSFRGRSEMPAKIRALGLVGLDTVSPLRDWFTRSTMGLSA
ncbi:MAG: FAD-dependent monooxygenase [Granulosicoccus sp.]|nr:FAD-dependent monooxygenase [Granulosicoccus sp.]